MNTLKDCIRLDIFVLNALRDCIHVAIFVFDSEALVRKFQPLITRHSANQSIPIFWLPDLPSVSYPRTLLPGPPRLISVCIQTDPSCIPILVSFLYCARGRAPKGTPPSDHADLAPTLENPLGTPQGRSEVFPGQPAKSFVHFCNLNVAESTLYSQNARFGGGKFTFFGNASEKRLRGLWLPWVDILMRGCRPLRSMGWKESYGRKSSIGIRTE